MWHSKAQLSSVPSRATHLLPYFLTSLLPYFLTSLLPYFLTSLLPYFLTSLLVHLLTSAMQCYAMSCTVILFLVLARIEVLRFS